MKTLLETWKQACQLWQDGQQVHAEDLLFDAVDDALLAKSWQQVNQLLWDITLDEAPLGLVLVLLTAILPAKDKLRDYEQFLDRVRAVWWQRVVDNFEECFRGLL